MGAPVNASPIYLDHAATGWPKSPAVYAAVEHQMRSVGVAAGRGAYERAGQSGAVIQRCRAAAARCFQSSPDGCWVLATSGTHALNQAIQGLLQPGDHVVTTAADHNSVLRPLHALAQCGLISWDIVPVDAVGRVSVPDIAARLKPETRLLAVTHGSNVTGAVQPLEALADVYRDHRERHSRLRWLVDAAQTAGLVPIALNSLPIDMLATPGHKYLGGPLGTGLLYLAPAVREELRPLMPGGTGSFSESLDLQIGQPESYEAGNLNVPALAGLAVALEHLASQPASAAPSSRTDARTLQLANRLRDLPNLGVISTAELPIISLVHDGLSPADLAAILDAEFQLETRAGLHCAPRIHTALGTLDGTLRVSFAPDTPDEHLEHLLFALREICCHG